MRYHYYVSVILALIFTLTFTPLFGIKDVQAQQNQTSEKESATKGESLSNVIFNSLNNISYQQYLDAGDKNFKLADINADVILVQIFSMYCPHCQRDAPNMNNFFNLIQKSESYKDKIKFIGIGVGNSEFEVEFFRKTYSVEFPLLPDQDFKIHKLLGEVRTPYFIGFKKIKDGSLKLFMSESGGDREPKAFLEQIVKQADIK
ncbi:MAG: TlpA family protein disulfide reductase [Desulfamplus sp.]|nr:TlpA family protein disulfide reductase [Desulfamplus sp.]